MRLLKEVNMDILRIEKLKKYYEGKQQTVKAVDAIDLSVKKVSS